MFELRPYRRNQVSVWNPFAEMEELEKKFFGQSSVSDFKTDIVDEGDHYELRADLPGFNKDDIHLDLEGDYLTITAERHSDHEEKDQQGKYVRWERSYGTYRRSFGVADVDQACGRVLDLLNEYEGAADVQRLEDGGANIYVEIPSDNASDFLTAALPLDASGQERELPVIDGEGTTLVLLTLTAEG